MTTILIKKYKNRRLYDTEKSQYITVEDLQQYVVDGLLFRVEDSSSGKDITSATLLQIFVEMEAGTSPFLSPDVLRQLIVLAHHPLSKSFKLMLQQMMTTMGTSLENNDYLTNYKKSTEAWNKQLQEAIKNWPDFFS